MTSLEITISVCFFDDKSLEVDVHIVAKYSWNFLCV